MNYVFPSDIWHENILFNFVISNAKKNLRTLPCSSNFSQSGFSITDQVASLHIIECLYSLIENKSISYNMQNVPSDCYLEVQQLAKNTSKLLVSY